MRAVIQRVTMASVVVDHEVVGAIDDGILVLLGIGHDDTDADATALVDKILGLRIFADDDGRMNLSVVDAGGSVLVVSQFTLLADVRRGRRPSFTAAAAPDHAERLVLRFVDLVRQNDVEVATGQFGASMELSLLNHGPVTLIVETAGGRVV